MPWLPTSDNVCTTAGGVSDRAAHVDNPTPSTAIVPDITNDDVAPCTFVLFLTTSAYDKDGSTRPDRDFHYGN